MKRRMILVTALALTLVFLASCALAAALHFSPRYDALQLADQALLNKYGITDTMQTALLHTITEKNGATIVTYEVIESSVMQENRFGTYTVTVDNGKANAVWSLDGIDTAGGLDAPAWGAEQLLMYVQDYGAVMKYLAAHNMWKEIDFNEEQFWQQAQKWEQDKQAALAAAKITLNDAAAIGREAIIVRYGLDTQQASMLVRYTDNDEHNFHDESTYEIVDHRPLVNLFFHLTQNTGEWKEHDGTYVVTINLLDGAVEDILYDSGLMGNG